MNYCIGKQTRFKEGQVVKSPPYEINRVETLYDMLRTKTFWSVEEAQLACQLATFYNPVGFVVLSIETSDSGWTNE